MSSDEQRLCAINEANITKYRRAMCWQIQRVFEEAGLLPGLMARHDWRGLSVLLHQLCVTTDLHRPQYNGFYPKDLLGHLRQRGIIDHDVYDQLLELCSYKISAATEIGIDRHVRLAWLGKARKELAKFSS